MYILVYTMQLTKRAVRIGNGAAIYVPKKYGGKELIVIFPEEIQEIRKRVLTNLIDFMPNIIGIYLYGSYARNEQKENSDIDIFAITQEKDENIKKELSGFDARIMTLKGVKNAIENYPLLIMPILKEAKPLLNPHLLEELKNSKIELKKLKWNFEDIKRIIKIIEGFIEIDKNDISPSHIYSLMIRIRSCLLMECLLKNKKFSNESIKRLLINYGFEEKAVDNFFDIYALIRENKEFKINVKKSEILRLIKFLKEYSKKLENETKKKIGKRY